jgi:hypothetical protein
MLFACSLTFAIVPSWSSRLSTSGLTRRLSVMLSPPLRASCATSWPALREEMSARDAAASAWLLSASARAMAASNSTRATLCASALSCASLVAAAAFASSSTRKPSISAIAAAVAASSPRAFCTSSHVG